MASTAIPTEGALLELEAGAIKDAPPKEKRVAATRLRTLPFSRAWLRFG